MARRTAVTGPGHGPRNEADRPMRVWRSDDVRARRADLRGWVVHILATSFSCGPAAVYGAAKAHSDEVIREHAAPRCSGCDDGRDHAARGVVHVVDGVCAVDVNQRDGLRVGEAVGVRLRCRVRHECGAHCCQSFGLDVVADAGDFEQSGVRRLLLRRATPGRNDCRSNGRHRRGPECCSQVLEID